jgi:hypothetical protein
MNSKYGIDPPPVSLSGHYGEGAGKATNDTEPSRMGSNRSKHTKLIYNNLIIIKL